MKKVAVVGSFVTDLTALTPHLPEPGETVLGSRFQMGPGGKGANQAAAAKRAGADLVFSTKLGRDSFAQIALDSFRRDGLSTQYVFQTDDAPTGAAVIMVDSSSKQNEIVVVSGACGTYDGSDLSRLDAMLEGCEYLLLQLEINMDATLRLIDLAHEKGIRVILNPAPVTELPREVYRKLYLVTPNEVEARLLTGIACDDDAGCRSAARYFLDSGVENVIITLGRRGACLVNRAETMWFENYDVPVVDTTGAGDAFNGGLLAGLSQGMSLAQAAQFGTVTANLAVTKLGTALAMPSRQEIEDFIAQHSPL